MRHSGLAIRDAACIERAKIQKDADRVTSVVMSRAKTGVDVCVAIPPEVAEALADVANGDPKYVFWTGASVPRTVTTNFQNDLRKVFDEAGIPDGHSHRFRDTAAVEWLSLGSSACSRFRFCWAQ